MSIRICLSTNNLTKTDDNNSSFGFLILTAIEDKILDFKSGKFIFQSLGVIKEVKLLMKKEKKLNKKNLIKTIGFKELKNFLLKKNSINEASELALQATRNYAKRQYTWFRHQYKANIIFKKKYEEKTKEYFLKKIQDKLLTN